MEENETGGNLSDPYTLQNNSMVSSITQKQVENFSSLPATSSLFNLQNNRRVCIFYFHKILFLSLGVFFFFHLFLPNTCHFWKVFFK